LIGGSSLSKTSLHFDWRRPFGLAKAKIIFRAKDFILIGGIALYNNASF
jgi:hypothetical protein